MLKKGDRLYSVATGSVDLRNKNSRKAMSYIKNLEGFVAVHPAYPNGMLSFFDSLNNAKRARNNMIMQGIKTGNNICEFQIDANGVPVFTGIPEEKERIKRGL